MMSGADVDSLPSGPRTGSVTVRAGCGRVLPERPLPGPLPVAGEHPQPDRRRTTTRLPPTCSRTPGDHRPGGTEPGLAADRQRRDRQQSTGPGPPHAGGGHHRRLAGERAPGPRSAPDRPGHLDDVLDRRTPARSAKPWARRLAGTLPLSPRHCPTARRLYARPGCPPISSTRTCPPAISTGPWSSSGRSRR